MKEISIIIPLYNKDKYVKETLKSVLAQTFQDFEIIVVNDGSTDHSERAVKSVKDERIKIFNIDNHGVSNARNFGVSKASTELIALLDADDVWIPNHLENLVNLHRKFSKCGMYATAYNIQHNNKTVLSEYYKVPKQPHWKGVLSDFFECSSMNCIASSSSVMIPKNIYESLGGFNTAYNSGEDTDFWIRIALKHSVAFINENSVVINMDADNQATKSNINFRKLLDFDTFKEEEETNPGLKKYLDLNRFSIAIQYKLAGNNLKAKEFSKRINSKHLNFKQQLLLLMDAQSLRKMVQLKNLLQKTGLGLSAFR